MPDALLVFNPAAGRFPSRMLIERAADVLSAKGWNTRLERTNGGPQITQLAKDAVAQNMEGFFIAGGDGSINFAVAGLVGSQTALGVLPSGTANVWAKELGLPDLAWTRLLALEESARLLGLGSIRSVDVGYCNEHPFLLWAGVGLDAFVVHRVEPRNRVEKHFAVAHYASVLVREASTWGGLNLDIFADDQEVTGHYLLAVVSNIHLYAGGIAEISPSACLDDGQMDLWLFAGDTLSETVLIAFDMLSGRHVDSDRARCIPFRRLQISSDSQLYFQLDGEPFQADTSVNVEVRPKSLRVIVPDNAPRSLFVED